jgi:hypothetical protein
VTDTPISPTAARQAACTDGCWRNTTWVINSNRLENNKRRVYCAWATRLNHPSSCLAFKQRSRIARAITGNGIRSAKRPSTGFNVIIA